MNNHFEHFLMEKHAERYPMVLDDDLPDAFRDWEPDFEDICEYADEYRNQSIEKLIAEIPDEEVCTCGCQQEYESDLKQQLRAKWLGKESV